MRPPPQPPPRIPPRPWSPFAPQNQGPPLPKSHSTANVLASVVVIIAALVPIFHFAVASIVSPGIIIDHQGGPQTIGIVRQDTSSDWILEIVSLPATHAADTTTFLMRWLMNSTVVSPPGQATLRSLETASGGVQYLPINGAAQIELRVADRITIAKIGAYGAGMQITIADQTTILWSGTL